MSFRIHATGRSGQWVAHAERIETGDRFGLECVGESEAEVVGRLARWLEWQGEHETALEVLQAAERAYHPTVADAAFTSPDSGVSGPELRSVALELLEAARIRLDEIRARKPS